MDRYDIIQEVNISKSIDRIVEKFNPYHDARGRFATAGGATSFTYSPGKSRAHDLAIQREKDRHAGGSEQKYVNANNTDEVGKVLKESLSDLPMYSGAEFDFTGLSLENAKLAAAQYEKLSREYSSTNKKNGIKGIGTSDLGPNTAGIGGENASITISSRKYAGAATEDQTRSGSVTNTVTHEFAHYLCQPTYKADSRGTETESTNKMREELRSLFRQFKKAGGTGLGSNALKNADEFFAEAFSQGKLSSSPSEFAIKAVAVADKYCKRR